MTVEIIHSPRGFAQYGGSVTTDHGHKVEVYESSAAFGPFVWLKVEGSTHVQPGSHNPNYDHNMGGLHVYESGSTVAHMTPEQARAVIERLQAWLDEITEAV